MKTTFDLAMADWMSEARSRLFGDLRCCNICIDRAEVGKGMHYCTGCCRYICTRARCKSLHARKCKFALGEPTPAGTPKPPAPVREIEVRR